MNHNETFPFSLDDIAAWIIRKKDGTVTRYNVVSAEAMKLSSEKSKRSSTSTSINLGYSVKKSYSDWCSHLPNPTDPPIFSNGRINLFIADAPGARKAADLFDVAIDGGGVLTIEGEYDLPFTYGDPKLVRALSSHVIRSQNEKKETSSVKILKIRWIDRGAPPVYPSFWPALLEELYKLQEKKGSPLNVLTICQGGHGRSGSALVALMMCMTDYTPLDALTHIRALHCARAIESKEQHLYLNLLAKELGRDENALEAEGVPSFKARFLAMDSPVAAPYKARVEAGKGAGDREREAGYL